MQLSLEDLVTQVNQWCATRAVTPASGQVADNLSVRTLRYYRSVGLLDAPASGGGTGYGEHHFLQVVALRILQAQGLPQSRIHALLFGRSDKELRKIVEHTAAPLVARSSPPTFNPSETWQVAPLDEEFLLVSRHGHPIPPKALARIRTILAEVSSSRTISTL
jgi:DNA-binding transcriptional MerR regulator